MVERIAKRPEIEAQRAGGKALAQDCPSGRVTVSGTVLKIKERESDFGTVEKMTVKADAAFIVWVSKPRSMSAERGQRVIFTCTLTPSERDPKFGFGKRPVEVPEVPAR